jgi:hypothetical protein
MASLFNRPLLSSLRQSKFSNPPGPALPPPASKILRPLSFPLPLQVWFDDPKTLSRLYDLAAELGLRGVGMWNLDCLDYGCSDPECRGATDAMWAAVREFTGWKPGTVH